MKKYLLNLIPVFSGLVGKIALVSSFAIVWANELEITNPNFVLENVRLEILLGSIITLIASILFKSVSPSGTLAPLVVLIPFMAIFNVHPLMLSVITGIIGIIFVKTGLFNKLLKMSGIMTKTSITLAFGISGIFMSLTKLHDYFKLDIDSFFILIVSLIFLTVLLYLKKLKWLVIPAVSFVTILIAYLFNNGINIKTHSLSINFSPSYWWNDMWGIGYGFDIITILKTIPFAIFIILLWTIDTLSIETIRDSSYAENEEKEYIDIEKSFIIVSLRNIIVSIMGGAQTASLWRSFLIPLFVVKKSIRICGILLGIIGIFSALTIVPIQIMSYTPLVWSVLLFGIFLPFTIAGFQNIVKEEKKERKILIVIFSSLGIFINPVFTWLSSISYEKIRKK